MKQAICFFNLRYGYHLLRSWMKPRKKWLTWTLLYCFCIGDEDIVQELDLCKPLTHHTNSAKAFYKIKHMPDEGEFERAPFISFDMITQLLREMSMAGVDQYNTELFKSYDNPRVFLRNKQELLQIMKLKNET